MKKIILLLSCFALLGYAQTPPPDKKADFEKRFKEALQAIDTQNYQKAREICEGIIKEEPKARGSLLIAGMASLELFENDRALPFLEAFRKLEPSNAEGILFSIQANQAEKRTAKVESLRKELFELRKTNEKLKASPFFIRERFKSAPQRVVIVREYYDFTQAPFKVWQVSEINSTTQEEVRYLDFSYNVAASQLKTGETYFFGEIIRIAGVPKEIKIYREEKSLPEYSIFRKWMTDALQNPPAAIYTAPYQSANPAPTPATTP